MKPASLAVLAVLTACAGPGSAKIKGPNDATGTGTGVAATGTGTGVGTGTGTGTGTGSGSLADFDCSTMPDMPLSDAILDGPRGYNDLVFDLNGEMIGHDGSTDVFMRAPDAASAAPLVAHNDTVYKMGMLSGGDFVAASDDDGLIRVTPAGATSTVLPGIRGYGLAVHANDMVYVATNYTSGTDGIIRVDPDTGDWEVLEAMNETPRAIAFSRDFSVLYIGTTDNGRVLRLPLDANGDPTGSASLLVQVPDEWHDTVEVDACGNIYVGSVFSTSIYRVNSDLSVDEIITWTGGFNGPYGHGLEWGVARGGWNEMAIYVTHPYIGSRVSEWVLGVPGQAWVGNVIGGTTL